MGSCPFLLYHFCQGEYVLLNYIDFDGAERSGAEDFSQLCLRAMETGQVRYIEEGGIQRYVQDGIIIGGRIIIIG